MKSWGCCKANNSSSHNHNVLHFFHDILALFLRRRRFGNEIFFPQDRMDQKIVVVDLYIMAETSNWSMTMMPQQGEVADESTYES